MDNDLIKSLIAALEASSLSELEYSSNGTRLRLVRQSSASAASASRPRVAASAPKPAPTTQPQPSGSMVKAPMFGVVHLSRAPDAPPLVAVGQSVAKGEILCLIEAMKVFTELRAEQAGTIAEILVRSGQEIEAGQVLFRLE